MTLCEWFLTVGAADGSLLRDDEVGEEHEEDAGDEADVEVALHRAFHALPGAASAISRLLLPLLLVVLVVVVSLSADPSTWLVKLKTQTVVVISKSSGLSRSSLLFNIFRTMSLLLINY